MKAPSRPAATHDSGETASPAPKRALTARLDAETQGAETQGAETKGAETKGVAFSVVYGPASIAVMRGFVRDNRSAGLEQELLTTSESDSPRQVRLSAPSGVDFAAFQTGAVGLGAIALGHPKSDKSDKSASSPLCETAASEALQPLCEASLRAALQHHLSTARDIVRDWNAGTIRAAASWCGRGVLGIFPICCFCELDEVCLGRMKA